MLYLYFRSGFYCFDKLDACCCFKIIMEGVYHQLGQLYKLGLDTCRSTIGQLAEEQLLQHVDRAEQQHLKSSLIVCWLQSAGADLKLLQTRAAFCATLATAELEKDHDSDHWLEMARSLCFLEKCSVLQVVQKQLARMVLPQQDQDAALLFVTISAHLSIIDKLIALRDVVEVALRPPSEDAA